MLAPIYRTPDRSPSPIGGPTQPGRARHKATSAVVALVVVSALAALSRVAVRRGSD